MQCHAASWSPWRGQIKRISRMALRLSPPSYRVPVRLITRAVYRVHGRTTHQASYLQVAASCQHVRACVRGCRVVFSTCSSLLSQPMATTRPILVKLKPTAATSGINTNGSLSFQAPVSWSPLIIGRQTCKIARGGLLEDRRKGSLMSVTSRLSLSPLALSTCALNNAPLLSSRS